MEKEVGWLGKPLAPSVAEVFPLKEDFMVDAYLRRSVAVLLSWLLVVPFGTLLAATPIPIGALQSQGTVYLGQDAASPAAVIYSGDTLRTDDGKATVSLPQGDLLVLGGKSAVALSRTDEAIGVSLEKGLLAFTSASQLPLRIEADGLTVSPAASFRTLAEIALLDDGTLHLAVRSGKVSVANLRPEPVVLTAGQVLSVEPRLAQAQQSKPIGTGAHGKMTTGEKMRSFHIGGLSHAASVAVVVGVVGGAAATAIAVPLVVGNEEAVSPSTP
jgi:hypothetical protein